MQVYYQMLVTNFDVSYEFAADRLLLGVNIVNILEQEVHGPWRSA